MTPPPEPVPASATRPGFMVAGLAVLAMLAAGALAYRGGLLGSAQPATTGPAFTRTAVVGSGSLEESIRLTGRTVARNSVVLRAPYLRGRRARGGSTYYAMVLQSLVPSGSHVKKGDLVASFDMIAMRNRLDDMRAERVDAELQVKTLRSQLGVEREAYDQQVRLAKAAMDKAALDMKTAPVRSAIQVSLFKLAFDEGRARYQALVKQAPHHDAAAQAQIREAELALREAAVEERRAEANVAKMQVRAPVDGMAVVQEIYRGGQMNVIRAGDQLRSRQAFVEIVDSRSLMIEAKASQVDVERIRIGARAKIRFDAFPRIELTGRVFAMAPIATTSNARGSYLSEVPVFLKLEHGFDPRLTADLAVSANVILDQADAPAIVPREAIFMGKSGDTFAYVRTPDGWKKREIELGLSNNLNVAVLAGLQPGETVAAAAITGLAEPNQAPQT